MEGHQKMATQKELGEMEKKTGENHYEFLVLTQRFEEFIDMYAILSVMWVCLFYSFWVDR